MAGKYCRNKTTRVGNGQLYGTGLGPARGPRPAFQPGNPQPVPTLSSIERKARGARMESRLEEIALQAENLNAAVAATKALVERDLGGVTQRTELSGRDGGDIGLSVKAVEAAERVAEVMRTIANAKAGVP